MISGSDPTWVDWLVCRQQTLRRSPWDAGRGYLPPTRSISYPANYSAKNTFTLISPAINNYNKKWPMSIYTRDGANISIVDVKLARNDETGENWYNTKSPFEGIKQCMFRFFPVPITFIKRNAHFNRQKAKDMKCKPQLTIINFI